MNLLKISWKNLVDKPLNSFLSVLLLSLGVAIISLLVLVGKQLEEKFTRNVKGIDMVLGAKGSPLQLILSSVYQLDAPTGNISLEEVNRLRRNPLVKSIIPLSIGDNYEGYRIIGSTPQYLEHFEASFQSGKAFSQDMEVVVGSKVARNKGLKVGDTFASQHGFDHEGEQHKEQLFKVVGVLNATNSVLDQLIVTPLGSVWAVHEHKGEQHSAVEMLNSEEEHHEEEESKEVTAALVKFRNPVMGMMLARNINQNTTIQAALPAIEINRLFELLGFGIETLQLVAVVIIVVSGISVFVSLYNSLKERRYEMALMLSMGASRLKLFFLLLLEGLLLSVMGFVSGIVLSRIGLWALSQNVSENFHYDFQLVSLLKEEYWLLLGTLAIGLLAAALPSIGIYKINISKTLAEE